MIDDSLSKQCKEILSKNYLNPIERLGKGGFGTVYLVSKVDFQKDDVELFSVKCTSKKSFVKKPVLRRYLKQQINLMSTLDHPNIVRLIRTFEDDGWIFMVMEYCNSGNLSSMLSKKQNKVCSLQEAKKIVCEVIEGLEYMHERKIVHRDIKPENILLTKNDKTGAVTTKICDLGFSRELHEEADTVCGTTYYMAPEIFEKKKYDYKVDNWALGVLFFMMIFGAIPFKSVNMISEIKKKCENGFNLDEIKIKQNDSISETDKQMLKDLFKNIFKIDPNERLSLSQIKGILMKESNFSSKSRSQKETIQSDLSSYEEDQPALYIQQVQFVQAVLQQVCSMKFLTSLEEIALKYYLNKVCLSVLSSNNHSEAKCKYLDSSVIEKMSSTQHSHSVSLASNIPNLGIKKFGEVFSRSSSLNFQQFKQAYRLVVGHAFYRAHKTITDYKQKCQIKLKLFCCHVINRVFEEQYSQQLFHNYYRWLWENKKSKKLNLSSFKTWIESEDSGKILESVEAINNKFYRKKK